MPHRIGWLASISAILGILGAGPVDDPPRQATVAPGDYQIIDTDPAGAYFVARPLKERYDKALLDLTNLRKEIADARVDGNHARLEVNRLTKELQELKDQINRAKLYVPGTTVHRATTTETFPIGPDSFLLVDASQVEVRGWNGAEVRCIVEKTVLGGDGKGVDEEFEAILVNHRKVDSRQVFGYYHDIADRPESKGEMARFPFSEFLGREFHHVRLVGLDPSQGNRQISVTAKNEQGAGMVSSRWRRQAKLILMLPACGRIGVRGGRGGFRIENLSTPVAVLGDGDRDYQAKNEVSSLHGDFRADGITIHRICGIVGNVAITCTADEGNTSISHNSQGTRMYPGPYPKVHYTDIDGSLTVRLLRGDLTVQRITGRIDVVNEFGAVGWWVEAPPGRYDHRIVAQAGTINVWHDENALDDLPLAVYTECGNIHLWSNLKSSLVSSMFSSAEGDERIRSWSGFVSSQAEVQAGPDRSRRVADALHGRSREPGVDLINRGGNIFVQRLKR